MCIKMQSLNLERGDLLQLVPISNTGTIKLLPLGKKNKVSKSHAHITFGRLIRPAGSYIRQTT